MYHLHTLLFDQNRGVKITQHKTTMHAVEESMLITISEDERFTYKKPQQTNRQTFYLVPSTCFYWVLRFY